MRKLLPVAVGAGIREMSRFRVASERRRARGRPRGPASMRAFDRFERVRSVDRAHDAEQVQFRWVPLKKQSSRHVQMITTPNSHAMRAPAGRENVNRRSISGARRRRKERLRYESREATSNRRDWGTKDAICEERLVDSCASSCWARFAARRPRRPQCPSWRPQPGSSLIDADLDRE